MTLAVHYRLHGSPAGTYFVTNGPSVSVPEFPTIALPVVAILGLMLILGRRNKV
jgi:hypothetical protein